MYIFAVIKKYCRDFWDFVGKKFGGVSFFSYFCT